MKSAPLSNDACELLAKLSTLAALILAVAPWAPWWTAPLPIVALAAYVWIVARVWRWRMLRDLRAAISAAEREK